MKNRHHSIAAIVAALSLGIVPMTSAWATHRTEAEQAIAEAKAAHEKAAEADVASLETQTLIEQAEKLMPSRQFTKAVKIANKAKMQDTFAYEQASGSITTDVAADRKAKQAIDAAEKARKQAASVGGEWRDTAKMIKNAKDLEKSGRFEEATELATKAQHQGTLGYEQAMAEKDADFPSYVPRRQ
ncbi:hypothetical protein ThidrDRAFT_2418 [Thiorhodococcus drewsii AZ1]|uniref:SoxXA-binding protein n=1 Tax=Thiorhodococcus drewsii AZ1 TaxID=765913 RepID=G2E2I6_9GAMM|nr:hypothetical protein [Thiorhodococcus drewsii]EGV30786.1 hypothetical protein ThidrDRAFT_2418 [Thiorhodococcus drewsii AZ1]